MTQEQVEMERLRAKNAELVAACKRALWLIGKLIPAQWGADVEEELRAALGPEFE